MEMCQGDGAKSRVPKENETRTTSQFGYMLLHDSPITGIVS